MGFDINSLLGKEEEEAHLLCEHYNYKMRVTSRNGSYGICTQDYRLDRVNVSVTDGKVTYIKGIG